MGPEQNFTHIAITRPEIAFIVDLRRQAMLQHLLYKAVFHGSPTRASFLSNLFRRPLERKNAQKANPTVEKLVEYFISAAAPEREVPPLPSHLFITVLSGAMPSF